MTYTVVGGRNPVISLGIHAIWEFCVDSLCWPTESDICVSCALDIATLLTTDSEFNVTALNSIKLWCVNLHASQTQIIVEFVEDKVQLL